jgi:hypothetical protein
VVEFAGVLGYLAYDLSDIGFVLVGLEGGELVGG